MCGLWTFLNGFGSVDKILSAHIIINWCLWLVEVAAQLELASG